MEDLVLHFFKFQLINYTTFTILFRNHIRQAFGTHHAYYKVGRRWANGTEKICFLECHPSIHDYKMLYLLDHKYNGPVPTAEYQNV